MKLEVLKCPSCGANIEFEEGIESCECEYCGAKVTVAPSQEKNNNIPDVLKKINPAASKPTVTKKINTNSTEEGPVKNILKRVFNGLFVANLFMTGICAIMAIVDTDGFSLFIAFFFLIYAAMFKVLALTPKGSKYILGKKKGLKPIYFVLICILLSFAVMMLSPDTSDTETISEETSSITEHVTVSE